MFGFITHRGIKKPTRKYHFYRETIPVKRWDFHESVRVPCKSLEWKKWTLEAKKGGYLGNNECLEGVGCLPPYLFTCIHRSDSAHILSFLLFHINKHSWIALVSGVLYSKPRILKRITFLHTVLLFILK